MAIDWPKYNEALVRRGEILLDLSLLKSWGDELEEMNRDREGGRYRYPGSLIELQASLRACFRLPYRQLEGFTRALSRWEPRLISKLRRMAKAHPQLPAPDTKRILKKGSQTRSANTMMSQ